MQTTISVGIPAEGRAGDSFLFVPPSSYRQYHFEVMPNAPGMVVGIWRGRKVPQVTGVARSKPNLNFVDHVCGAGTFEISVENPPTHFTILVTQNSIWKQWFG